MCCFLCLLFCICVGVMVWSPFSLHTCPLSAISTPVCCHTFSPAYKSCGQTASPSCTHTLCLCRLFFRRPIVVCLPAGLWELLLFVPSQDYLPASASTKPTPQPACIVFYWEGGLGIFFISYIGNALGINLLANINKTNDYKDLCHIHIRNHYL